MVHGTEGSGKVKVCSVTLPASIDARILLLIFKWQFRLSETSYKQTNTDWMC